MTDSEPRDVREGKRPKSPEGHRSLGYTGVGNYRCQCGENFSMLDLRPLPASATEAIQALKDQWVAHYTPYIEEET
jgi:hypothetical protein